MFGLETIFLGAVLPRALVLVPALSGKFERQSLLGAECCKERFATESGLACSIMPDKWIQVESFSKYVVSYFSLFNLEEKSVQIVHIHSRK